MKVPKILLGDFEVRYVQIPYHDRFYIIRNRKRICDEVNISQSSSLIKLVLSKLCDEAYKDDSTVYKRFKHFEDSVRLKDEHLDKD